LLQTITIAGNQIIRHVGKVQTPAVSSVQYKVQLSSEPLKYCLWCVFGASASYTSLF